MAALALTGCGLVNHNNDPQSCRERAAYRLAETYPDPVMLDVALDTICDGVSPVVPASPVTTAAPATTVFTGPPPTVFIDTLPTGTFPAGTP